jgi:hypothetical protein
MSAEIYFMRPAGHTLLDHKRTKEFMRELKIPQITKFIQHYKNNGKEQDEL